jgi:hypothetical protein
VIARDTPVEDDRKAQHLRGREPTLGSTFLLVEVGAL